MKKAVLSITGSDYLQYIGGTNKLIIAHQSVFEQADFTYICIFPFRILERFKGRHHNMWCVRINGDLTAIVKTVDLKNYFYQCGYKIIEIHIHQLLNIEYDVADNILSSFRTEHIRVFLHDYQYICKNYLMLKNDKNFCGVNPPSESKCNSCVYADKTFRMRAQILDLFSKYIDRIELVAPSVFVENMYKKSFPNFKIVTVPHQIPVGNYKSTKHDANKFKIAFIGYANKTKGWEEFEKAIHGYTGNKIEFLHYGKGGEDNNSVKHICVDTSRDPDAMVNSLRKDNVDIAVLWSVLPETYSYTYNECLMAAVPIIANSLSGNIADNVNSNHSGVVLNGVEELKRVINDENCIVEILDNTKINAPNSFIDNDWILKNVGFPIEEKFSISKKNYNHYIIKLLYSLKWMVKGR